MSESEDRASSGEPSPTPKQEIIEPKKPRDDSSTGLLSRLLDIEHERIASSDKRTEVMRLAIEANIASDTRQFEFHMERLRVSDARTQRRDTLARIFVLSVIILGAIATTFLLGLAFYGSERQSTVALQIIYYVLTGVGGYGVLSTVRRGVKSLIENKNNSEDP